MSEALLCCGSGMRAAHAARLPQGHGRWCVPQGSSTNPALLACPDAKLAHMQNEMKTTAAASRRSRADCPGQAWTTCGTSPSWAPAGAWAWRAIGSGSTCRRARRSRSPASCTPTVPGAMARGRHGLPVQTPCRHAGSAAHAGPQCNGAGNENACRPALKQDTQLRAALTAAMHCLSKLRHANGPRDVGSHAMLNEHGSSHGLIPGGASRTGIHAVHSVHRGEPGGGQPVAAGGAPHAACMQAA